MSTPHSPHDAPQGSRPADAGPRLAREPFAVTPEGRTVERFTLTNAHGMEVRVLTYGGILQAMRVPDRTGALADVVLGYDTYEEYVQDRAYFGPLIGRYANRIARGRFTLDGREYTLPVNDGPNHLHGGIRGFHKVLWDAEPYEGETEVGVVLTYVSPDGEEGYPGTLTTRVTYVLTERNELVVDYAATTDAPTPVSLTQHVYFNLAGDGTRDVLAHELTLHASRFTPVDPTLIPTGELQPVAGTPFDFTRPTPIGERLGADDAQLRPGRGYDHNFVLDAGDAGTLSPAARLYEPESGRVLEILTTEPGVQFYSGNYLDGERGKEGRVYQRHYGLALETQHFPDSPNQPHFPSTILRPGDRHTSRTIYRFATEGA